MHGSVGRMLKDSSLPIPEHIAIIMDGNGRWACSRGLPRIEGHKAGVKAVRRIVETCHQLGVRYLTLFSFSSENWRRSPEEVAGLMRIFRSTLDEELDTLVENGVRLRAIGNLDKLPFPVRSALRRNIEKTKGNTGFELILAVSYGGREEIVEATKRIVKRVEQGQLKPENITEDVFASALWAPEVPDPDLLIRTSGELRISNFLLWQLAYTEIVVVPELWPEFSDKVLERCVSEFQQRERRFGLTADQIHAKLV